MFRGMHVCVFHRVVGELVRNVDESNTESTAKAPVSDPRFQKENEKRKDKTLLCERGATISLFVVGQQPLLGAPMKCY